MIPALSQRLAARHLAIVAAAVCLLAAGSARAQLASQNVELLTRVGSASERGAYAAVWGYTAPDGTELAMIGTIAETDFYDVTDARHPLQVAAIPGPRSRWREMQTWSHYAYIVTEGTGPEASGVQIVDMADPRDPIYVGQFDSTFVTAHTIHIAAGFAYINGSNTGWRILDLADPVHPREVGNWNGRYVHDCFVRGNLAYLANIYNGGFTILDIADKAHPREVSFTSYAGGATHNCWSTEDGHYLLTTDETQGGRLRIWDIDNPNAPRQVADWVADPQASIHNVVVRGDSAYIAYYTEGLQVLDIHNRTSPVRVGYYDTYPGVGGLFDGNWGVYPLAHNRNIYLSDINTGLLVVRMTTSTGPVHDFILSAPPRQTATPGQSQIWFFFDMYNSAPGPRTFDLTATNSAGWPMHVDPSITVARNGAEAVFVTVDVPPGITQATRVDVDLCAQSRTTGDRQCGETRISVAVTLEDFAAVAAPDGVELRWRLRHDAGDAGELLVLRAEGDARRRDGDAAFSTRARLGLEREAWSDTDVEPGSTWVYRLALADASGIRVLGEREVTLAAPARSRLLGNVPNPFNPQTEIRFELARAGDVTVALFDARGRHVRELQATRLGAGAHGVTWDGRDAQGLAVASGLYVYEVRSAGWSARGRMLLAK